MIISVQSFAQQQSGFYFLLNPNNPLKYYHSVYEEIYDYSDSSGYEDFGSTYDIREWRPCFSMGIEFGYQSNKGLIAGAGAKVMSDMFDIAMEFNVAASVGYKFNAPIALHARGGVFSANNATSYSLGGLLDFYFPNNSDRFDFGFRTGYTFSPIYKDREQVYEYGYGETHTTRRSMTYHIVELGLFFKWH